MEINKKNGKTDEAWKRLYARLENDGLLSSRNERGGTAPRLLLYVKRVVPTVAMIAGIIFCAAWLIWPERGDETHGLLTQENQEKAALVKTLEDGSVVYLAQESRLQYPKHFTADKRTVNLQGEAFFDIARKPGNTFMIETEKVRVEVLGTAFNIQSNALAPFSLSVKRGSVKVLLKQNGQTTLVKAGETATLRSGRLLLGETTYPNVFDRYVKNIRFKDECLEDVLRVINKESSYWQIETASPALGQKRLTVEFSNNSPEFVAELICWTFNLKCERKENRLVLFE